MADDTAVLPDDTPSQAEAEPRPSDIVAYWKAQLDAYDDEFKPWTDRCKKIIRRYRDERGEKSDGTVAGGARFNLLWSNVQTLQPAIYIKPPQPVVERRYLDKDPLARISSMTLERACEVQIEVGKLHPAMRKAVLDYLLCARGQTWERYEPTYGEAEDLGEGAEDENPARPVTYEKVATDYVAWDKFRHSPSAVWDDVWWVSKDEMLTRKELRDWLGDAKTPDGNKLLADAIPLRDGSKDKQNDREKKRKNPRALICEIWNKRDRKVIFIAPDYQDAPCKVTDDPLNLNTFWPCPSPLYGTLTNDSLVPVPDYAEYQDQADELDNITARIKALTDAVRVNGVYDASIPELKRILQEGADNRLIGVKNWAELTTKGGLGKAIDFVPFKDVVEALLALYDARDRVKADAAEITGISDIIRGQAQGGDKTATEQRIKGQFASLRLDDRKKEVSRFARDGIAIKAEIIAEQFSPEILSEMTGMVPFIMDELKSEMPASPASPLPAAGNGAMPGQAASPLPAGPQPDPAMMQQQLQQQLQQAAQQRFEQACALLKDDKMRTFRIDIETDSTVEPDRQAAKEAVVEMFTAVGGFLEKALPIGQMMPQLAPALGQSLLFAFRTFGAGRDVEGEWERAIDALTQASKNPGPKAPSPEEIKAKAEQDKAAAEMERSRAEFEMERQRAAEELQMERERNGMELQKEREKLQFERERLNMERERMQLKVAGDQQTAAIDAEAAQRDAQIDERAAVRDEQLAERASERDAEAGERDFELQRKTAEVKAKQAQKPKVKEPA